LSLPAGLALGTGTRSDEPAFRVPNWDAHKRVHRVQHLKETGILDAIVHPQALLAILDQAGLAEKHQLLRDIRLALAQ
jgi:hypothetical protein